jgi:predicted DNA-binding protein
MFALDDEQPTVPIAAKLPPRLAKKLAQLARDTYRTRSQVLRILVERATLADLNTRCSTGRGTDER